MPSTELQLRKLPPQALRRQNDFVVCTQHQQGVVVFLLFEPPDINLGCPSPHHERSGQALHIFFLILWPQDTLTVKDLQEAAYQILFNPSTSAAAAATFRAVLPQLLQHCLQHLHQEDQALPAQRLHASTNCLICLGSLAEVTPYIRRCAGEHRYEMVSA